ncbi:hypothetical protein ABG067_008048, partial [Albugo candida]
MATNTRRAITRTRPSENNVELEQTEFSVPGSTSDNANTTDDSNNNNRNATNSSGGRTVLGEMKRLFTEMNNSFNSKLNTGIADAMRSSAFNLRYGNLEVANSNLKRKLDEMDEKFASMEKKLDTLISVIQSNSGSNNGVSTANNNGSHQALPTLVEISKAAFNNISGWIREGVAQLNNDGMDWNYSGKILDDDNQAFIRKVK